jgi:hypothetical protein
VVADPRGVVAECVLSGERDCGAVDRALVQFTLWEDTAPESAGTRYRVLHLSTPELGELQAGRHW